MAWVSGLHGLDEKRELFIGKSEVRFNVEDFGVDVSIILIFV
jgi:hypothetical protein